MPGGHATIPAMTSRRDQRQTHVRPRSPSTGRPAPVKSRPRDPGPIRLSGHRPIQRSGGLPIVFRIALALAVVALGAGILFVGANGIGAVVSALGANVTGFISNVTSTPSPKPSIATVSDAPSLRQPGEPYTSQSTVDLEVSAPPGLAGNPDHRIRVYLTLPDQAPSPIQELAIAAEGKTVIPVELEKGINDFTVTIVGPGGESDPSAVVRYVYDKSPPKITITSPKDNAIVNGKALTIKGKTQARTTLLAHNDTNGSSIAGTAEPDGTFSLSLSISTGVNKIRLTGTDPAGNESEATLTVRRGTGKLTVSLSASSYQIRRSALPQAVTLFATVTDPDGRPLKGVSVTFTLSMPGVPTVTTDTRTAADGSASFRTTIAKGVARGQGSATVLVSSDEFGSTEDFTVISIVK